MATMTDFGVPYSGIQGILQPLHKNRWAITFNLRGGGNGRVLTAMALTADRPKLEFEPITLDRYNSRAYILGKHQFQPISLTFEPDIGGEVHRAIIKQLEMQQHLIKDDSKQFLGAAAGAADYKFSMSMRMLDGHHSVSRAGEIVEEWKIDGCMLLNNDFGDLDYSASETVKTVITVQYDHARLVPRGARKMATTGSSFL